MLAQLKNKENRDQHAGLCAQRSLLRSMQAVTPQASWVLDRRQMAALVLRTRTGAASQPLSQSCVHGFQV